MIRKNAAPGTRVVPKWEMVLNREKRHLRRGKRYTVKDVFGDRTHLKEVPGMSFDRVIFNKVRARVARKEVPRE